MVNTSSTVSSSPTCFLPMMRMPTVSSRYRMMVRMNAMAKPPNSFPTEALLIYPKGKGDMCRRGKERRKSRNPLQKGVGLWHNSQDNENW